MYIFKNILFLLLENYYHIYITERPSHEKFNRKILGMKFEWHFQLQSQMKFLSLVGILSKGNKIIFRTETFVRFVYHKNIGDKYYILNKNKVQFPSL